MGLKDKASKIGFGDLDDVVPASVEAASSVPGPTRARSGVAAITQTISMHHRVQDLEARVAEYEDASLVVMLDPRVVLPGKYKNRDERSFATSAYAGLKSEIEAAGRNVQAIKVRRLPMAEGTAATYEVVYGRRRLRACLELGIPVAAVVEDMDDRAAFEQMERENRNRADLSAWEQGVMYRDALEQGLFSSQRQLAAALGIDQSNLGKSIRLASLPEEVLEAFESPLDLQHRWAADLGAAFDKDPAGVLAKASELRNMSPRLAAKSVLAALVGSSPVAGRPAATQFSSAGKVVGTWSKDASGNCSLKVRVGTLSEAKEKRLLEFLGKLFQA